MKKPSVTIIGLGKVGSTFLNVLPEKGYRIESLFTKSPDGHTGKPGPIIKKGLPKSVSDLGTLVFLTVPDESIESISKKIASGIHDVSENLFIHCSGTLTSNSMAVLKEKGAKVASLHPIKSITKTTASFEGTWFDVEGDSKTLEVLEQLVKDVGAYSFKIDTESKPWLHASAVVASNYLVALAEIATRISEYGNIDKEMALQFLLPLMKNTVENLEEHGIDNALTGPVLRGDIETVKMHLDILKKDEKLAELYKQLGLITVDVAERKTDDPDSLEKIKKLLS